MSTNKPVYDSTNESDAFQLASQYDRCESGFFSMEEHSTDHECGSDDAYQRLDNFSGC